MAAISGDGHVHGWDDPSSIFLHMGVPSRLSVAHYEAPTDGADSGVATATLAATECERHVGGRVVLMPQNLSPWSAGMTLERYSDQWRAHHESRLGPLVDSPKWSMRLYRDGSLFVSSQFAKLTPVHGIAFWAGSPVCIVTEHVLGGGDRHLVNGYGVVNLQPGAVEEYVSRWSRRACGTPPTQIKLCMSLYAGNSAAELALEQLKQAATKAHISIIQACSGFSVPIAPNVLIVLDVRDRTGLR